ncbi:YLP motif-containing protein 1-like isoform X2 [Pieris brassicae]|uniref:YLP motif-containing protein 1-like isoform X2 n=1 Tax=Pieris brassicae TaxID=7116 RepID=UPI001E65FA8D|nr:YLP motif-containing protein 1-like isoform X2 [Pieris brassicae]
MAWQIPGPWNPGLSLAPDPSTMNMAGMSSLTAEQWSLMQQQNWQQWAQWQQQYAQWQTQYGDKYAEQMQGMPQLGIVPPQPTTIPPPAPPPPENPPPPPHENDQPLYCKPHLQTMLPSSQTQMYNQNFNNPNAGNINLSQKQNQTYNTEDKCDAPSQPTNSVNSEALMKLAEEERLFDVQFKKWEEEIEKWKKENVNHPDKRAYGEYEQKFEACRAQLLERRQQMNQKRATLMNSVSQTSSTGNTQNSSLNQNTCSKQTQPCQITKPPQSYPSQSSEYNQYGDNYKDDSRSNNISIDSQDRYDSYQGHNSFSSMRKNESNSNIVNKGCKQDDIPKQSFLSTEASKGIPGLDLVRHPEKAPQQDIVDITQEKTDIHMITGVGPDYSTISQGINNILGDAKIMNILSMVQIQASNTNNSVNVKTLPSDGQWNRSFNKKQDNFDNRSQGGNFDHQSQGGNYDNRLQGGIYNNKPQSGDYNIQVQQQPENNYGIRAPQSNNFDSRFPPPNTFVNRTPAPYNYENRPLIPNVPINQQNKPHLPNNFENRSSDYGVGQTNFDNRSNMLPENNNQMPINNYKKLYPRQPQDRYDQSYNENIDSYDQYGHPEKRNTGNKSGPPPQPLLEINTGINKLTSFDQRPDIPAPVPSKVSWSEDPLFSPSIIVEYEHKSLRLKARKFIEPVHTFDYNHKSKDEDKKKDFEKEVEELYTRKPRTEKEIGRRFRDPYLRDYERRPEMPKEESRPRLQREELSFREERPRLEFADSNRLDERRHDDRDRFRHEEYRNRERERDRDRDVGRDRENARERDIRSRDVARDRDYGRDLGRDRNLGREREYGRERDLGRERLVDHVKERDIEYGRDRDLHRDRDVKDRIRDIERDRNHSRSRENEQRKRAISMDSEISTGSKKNKTENPRPIVMIDDILEEPGRSMRPEKIVIILRGPPGSGKSYLAKLIRDKEAEHGGTVRIMSIDDYFMQEGETEERDPITGKIVKKPLLKYEYDEKLEETYITSLKRAFKRSITDGYFSFLIFDAVNDQLRSYADMWNFSRQNGFQVYICTMELDPQICHKRNIHNRNLEDIQVICSRFFETPAHHILLDPTTLLQSAAITEVTMEDAVSMEDVQETEVEGSFTSKWERMDDVNQLARLDGTSKPLRPKLSMEDYLQLDEWTPNKAKPGKKTVRWADIEERREQEKMRAIGFVVGQTDWNRMTDPTMGSSALTKTKYIERVRRN